MSLQSKPKSLVNLADLVESSGLACDMFPSRPTLHAQPLAAVSDKTPLLGHVVTESKVKYTLCAISRQNIGSSLPEKKDISPKNLVETDKKI